MKKTISVALLLGLVGCASARGPQSEGGSSYPQSRTPAQATPANANAFKVVLKDRVVKSIQVDGQNDGQIELVTFNSNGSVFQSAFVWNCGGKGNIQGEMLARALKTLTVAKQNAVDHKEGNTADVTYLNVDGVFCLADAAIVWR